MKPLTCFGIASAALFLIAMLPVIPSERTLAADTELEDAQGDSSEPWREMLGTWHATVAQKSLVISIEPGQKGLVLFIQPGHHSIDRVSWEPFHGGILVHDMPRKRLWRGRHDQELRVEIEPLPELPSDSGEEFPQRLFVRRVGERTLPAGWRERPVPDRWRQESPEAIGSR